MEQSEQLTLRNKVAMVMREDGKHGKAIAIALQEAGALVAEGVSEMKPRDAVGNTISKFGHLDILVTTPIVPQAAAAESISTEQFKQNIELNLGEVFFWCQAAAEQMSLQNPVGGTIINVSSVNGVVALPGQVAFCAAMAGVNAMTKTLGTEWQELGIRVLGLGAGLGRDALETMTLETLLPDGTAGHRRLPGNTLTTAYELGQVAAYLASDAARLISGTTVYADGGWLADGYWQ